MTDAPEVYICVPCATKWKKRALYTSNGTCECCGKKDVQTFSFNIASLRPFKITRRRGRP